MLCDTGAVKMWMARLYPTYRPNTCLISNGLATMAFSLPGAFAAKLVHPERKVLAAMGDGAFLMSAAEIETAVRERVPFVILVWVDGGYGLIGWKQDIHFGRQAAVSFGNPDFVQLAESFGARGYQIGAADELLPTLRKALDDDVVSVIACPVDYRENARLIERLGRTHRAHLIGVRGPSPPRACARGPVESKDRPERIPNSPEGLITWYWTRSRTSARGASGRTWSRSRSSCSRTSRSSRTSPTPSCWPRPPEFRQRVENGESLDDLLPEAFAAVREASKRSTGKRHFDVQVMGAAALHQGNIAEMKTGEGKTLVATMPGVPQLAHGRGRAPRDRERLPGQARLGVDGADLPCPRRARRADPVAHDAGRAAARVRRADHVRHEQRVRVRLPARQHGDADRGLRAARLPVRDRGRGRLDPHRRGADPADHQRHGGRQREVVPDVRADRAAAEARRGLRGRGVEVPGRRDRVGRREGRGDARHREPLRAREHAARAPHAERVARQGALQARRRVRGAGRRGEDRRRVHRPRAGGPALLGGPAPGDRGEGGRPDQGGEPDARHDHDPELLQDVRQARRA